MDIYGHEFIFQMAGNVDEWCTDCYQWDVYHRYAIGNLSPPLPGDRRVVRLGKLFGCQEDSLSLRTSPRQRFGNRERLYTGIRCACDAGTNSEHVTTV